MKAHQAVAAACALLLALFAQGARAQNNVTVYEFINTITNHYFIATQAEAFMVDAGSAGPGWRRTGFQFGVYETSPATMTPVCRFYAPLPTNSHFYAADPAECDFLKTHDTGWRYEGVAFSVMLPKNGACSGNQPTPVYRLYNNRAAQLDSNHRYAYDDRVRASMKAQGWVEEGVAFCTYATFRDWSVYEIFMPTGSGSVPSTLCTPVTPGGDCLGVTALLDMTQNMWSITPVQFGAPANPAYNPEFARRTGWSANADSVYAPTFDGNPVAHSYVEFAPGGQLIGVHVVGSDRRFGDYASIGPTLRLGGSSGFYAAPTPFAGIDDNDIVTNFQMIVTTVQRSGDAQAYGGPVLYFLDKSTGQYLLLRALAYSSSQPADVNGVDPVSGFTMVSTTFAKPAFGSVLKGQFISCPFATRASGGCPSPGIDFSYRVDRTEFVKALALARGFNASLSAKPGDYALLGIQVRNETFGDAELGLVQNAVQLFVTGSRLSGS